MLVVVVVVLAGGASNAAIVIIVWRDETSLWHIVPCCAPSRFTI